MRSGFPADFPTSFCSTSVKTASRNARMCCFAGLAPFSTEQLVDGPNLCKFQEMMRLEDMQKAKSDWAASAWAVTQVPDNKLLALDREKRLSSRIHRRSVCGFKFGSVQNSDLMKSLSLKISDSHWFQHWEQL